MFEQAHLILSDAYKADVAVTHEGDGWSVCLRRCAVVVTGAPTNLAALVCLARWLLERDGDGRFSPGDREAVERVAAMLP
jgi:hypothetical protein